MARADLERVFDHLVGATAAQLEPLGFARLRSAIRIFAEGNCGIVDFQRSTKSSGEAILFTVNVGVVYGELLDQREGVLQQARIGQAHLRQRIGMLMPHCSDKWWRIDHVIDADSVEHEVLEVVLQQALPYIRHYLNTDAIVALWQSGQSPGLTAMQRMELLSQLKIKREGGAI